MHFLPRHRTALFAWFHRELRHSGIFDFTLGAPPQITSVPYWAMLGFDLVMRVRNAVWRPPFVMYYRTASLPAVREDLTAAGFGVETIALTSAGSYPDGGPRCWLMVARKAANRH